MRYRLVKVLLTVSPSSPSFCPPLGVFSQLPTVHRSLSTLFQLTPLSTAFPPNRSLTPLSTAFTQTHRVWGCRVLASDLCVTVPLWQIQSFQRLARSSTLLPLFLQLRSFIFKSLHALLQKHPGWSTQSTLGISVPLWRSDFFPGSGTRRCVSEPAALIFVSIFLSARAPG
jgi:hypothetical protein